MDTSVVTAGFTKRKRAPFNPLISSLAICKIIHLLIPPKIAKAQTILVFLNQVVFA